MALILIFLISFIGAYRLNDVARSGARWKNLPINMELNTANSGLPAEATKQAIKAAMDEWNTKLNKNIFTVRENSSLESSETLSVNGTNAMTFSTNFNADSGGFDAYSVVAVGGQFSSGDEMNNAFVLYNAETVKWLVDGVKSSSSASYSDDLITITLHELGHVIGLGHSEVAEAVMSTDRSQQIKRKLTQDDIEGATYLLSSSSEASHRASGARFAGCASTEELHISSDPLTNSIVFLLALLPLLSLITIRIKVHTRKPYTRFI